MRDKIWIGGRVRDDAIHIVEFVINIKVFPVKFMFVYKQIAITRIVKRGFLNLAFLNRGCGDLIFRQSITRNKGGGKFQSPEHLGA